MTKTDFEDKDFAKPGPVARTPLSEAWNPHRHRIEGYPIRMTPDTKPNLAWRCRCGWWTFVRLERGPNGEHTWHPPASDERIRLQFMETLDV